MRNLGPIVADTSTDYLARLNRAIDHVRANLGRPLPLVEVARVAAFSPCHFHRVFKSLMGETLLDFVNRQRLERALGLMSTPHRKSLTEIAIECGFASSSDFSRAFKLRYGVPPSRFDTEALRRERRGELDALHASAGAASLESLPTTGNPDGFVVTTRRIAPRCLAYIRVFDPYRSGGIGPAYERLAAWAEANGCADRRWYGYQWEDPEITALHDCRYDVAVEVDQVVPGGEIGRLTLDATEVAEIEIRGDIELEMRALEWLFTGWLPHSGRSPADLPCFEAWHGRPFAHGGAHFELTIQLPLE